MHVILVRWQTLWTPQRARLLEWGDTAGSRFLDNMLRDHPQKSNETPRRLRESILKNLREIEALITDGIAHPSRLEASLNSIKTCIDQLEEDAKLLPCSITATEHTQTAEYKSQFAIW